MSSAYVLMISGYRPELKSWLIQRDNNTTAECWVCPIPRNKIELSNMGKQALKSHASRKKHCERLALYSQTSRISFTPISKPQPPPPSPLIQTPDNSSKISTLDSYIMSDWVTDAEIRWLLKSVLSFSFHFCDDLLGLFKAKFPDSAVAEKFSLQKDKCAYYLNYGIAPNFWSIVDEVQTSEYYAASFDESLNSVILMGQSELLGWCSESSLYGVSGLYFCWLFLN